jgi:hypothetical protein
MSSGESQVNNGGSEFGVAVEEGELPWCVVEGPRVFDSMVDNDLSIAGMLRKLLALVGCFVAIPEAMVGFEVSTDKRMWFGEELWEESDNSG